jgi:hypothetical protein
MKEKNIILKSIVTLICCSLLVVGCKKRDEATPNTPAATTTDGLADQTLRASDQSNVDSESELAMDDINSTLQDVSTTRDIQDAPCGATVDSIHKDSGRVIINYDGVTVCAGKKRSGRIVIQLPFNGTVTRWSTQNCVASIYFENYKITNVFTNKSVTFNGYHTIQNLTAGGYEVLLVAGGYVKHKIRGQMDLTFDNLTTRHWTITKVREFRNVIKATVNGDSTITGSYGHVVTCGTNRIGENFVVDIPTAITYYIYNNGTSCLYKPLTGVVIHYGVAYPLTITYGVTATGTPDTSPCPYGYKLSWSNAQGSPDGKVLPYQ